jgi:hypothetical protein
VTTFLVESSSAAVPKVLVDATLKTAALLAAGTVVTSQAMVLTQGVLNAMFLTKLKVVAAVLLVAGLLGTGTTVGVLAYGPQSPEQEQVESKTEPTKPQVEKPKPDPQKLKTVELLDLLGENNAARFDEQFMGQRLRLSVNPESVIRMNNPGGEASHYLVMVPGLRPFKGEKGWQSVSHEGWAAFKFDAGSRKSLAGIELGKPVTIEGRCLGKTWEVIPGSRGMQERPLIRFDDCRITNAEQ